MMLVEVVEQLAAALPELHGNGPNRMVVVVPPEVYAEFVDHGGIRLAREKAWTPRHFVRFLWRGRGFALRLVCREDMPPGQVRLMRKRDLRS